MSGLPTTHVVYLPAQRPTPPLQHQGPALLPSLYTYCRYYSGVWNIVKWVIHDLLIGWWAACISAATFPFPHFRFNALIHPSNVIQFIGPKSLLAARIISHAGRICTITGHSNLCCNVMAKVLYKAAVCILVEPHVEVRDWDRRYRWAESAHVQRHAVS